MNPTVIAVNAGTDETPYILLAFDSSITEEQIKGALKIKKDSQDIDINWLGDSTEIDSNSAINADTDIIKNNEDGKEYRVAILRLKEGGSYQVDTGDLALQKSESASVTSFEKLNLTLNNNQVSGEIKYAEENTKYVLRTYFANAEGGADYLIDEQEITNSSSISVNIPSMGALAPSGEYYVTSFLMTEKSVESIDENGEKETLTGLVAIDHQQFNTQVSYQNQNQPTAPQTVTLELAGNEVMTATWGAVTDADGYAVTIYQKDGNDWIDTGFGYDLDKETTSINMALTVGGEETTKSKNLSENETYKVGVSAYKTIEGGKYYSAETESAENGVYLPEYTPLDMMLSVNGTTCTADEHGVYRAYVDGKDDVLTVSCTTENVTYKVTRMDKTSDNEISTDSDGAYPIPNFEGSLMFKIDGISEIENSTAKDVTSVFLLVSVDKTAPVLTLSDPVFYADMTTGAYQITGTADAGSKIIYGNDGASVNAGSDGTFTIPGTLDKNSGVLSLCAQDSAGNKSTSRFALITKQNTATEFIVTFDGNGGTPSVGNMTTTNQKLTSLPSASQSKHSFDGWYTEKSGGTKITTDTVFHTNTTVYAHWTYIGGGGSSGYSYYTIKATAGTGGSISPSGNVSVREGRDQTFTITPDKGYAVANVKIDGKSIGAVKSYTFENVSRTHTIEVIFMKANGNPQTGVFVDVATGSYYEDAVDWAVENGITKGTDDTHFSPDGICTRAQAVTFLWRAAGSPEPETRAMPFTDVPAGSYYYDAVLWAVENGITEGTSDTTFSPNSTCTRAQIVAFLWRSEKSPAAGTANPFADVKSTAYYAGAVLWAVKEDITKGTTNTTFSPDADCTRAQIVTFLWRCKK